MVVADIRRAAAGAGVMAKCPNIKASFEQRAAELEHAADVVEEAVAIIREVRDQVWSPRSPTNTRIRVFLEKYEGGAGA